MRITGKIVVALWLPTALLACHNRDPDKDTAPVANAGVAQSVQPGSVVTLDGTGSTDADEDTLAYAWSFVTTPEGSTATLSDATSDHPTFTADIVGDYVVQLVVDDGDLQSAASTVTITATDDAPLADAGAAQSVTRGDVVTLDGSASSDANGDALTYAWTFTSQPQGSTATLDDTDPVHPTFTPDVAGSYIVQLIVNDGVMDSAPDTVTITAAPIVSTTNLVLNGSFEDGLTSWTQGTSAEANAAGNCGYNVDDAPGTETLTSTSGFPATDGTKLALGSNTSTSTGRYSCTLYQDIAVPAGTTSLVLSFDVGAKAGVDSCHWAGAFAGLYSTASVPAVGMPALAGSSSSVCNATDDTTLVSVTKTLSAPAVAGTTVRLGFVNVAMQTGHEVIGVDNVKLMATVSQ